MIPASVVVATKNEQKNIGACLAALKDYDEVVVVDSNSRDRTIDIAKDYQARIENFTWDGQYPKKRQWTLDNLTFKHDWIFFVDADEIVTADLNEELKNLFSREPQEAGYFVKGIHKLGDKILRHGLQNNKLCLFHKNKIGFPVVDDLDIPGMGEIEGHYQPVLKQECKDERIGQISEPLLHMSFNDMRVWTFHHEKYARWEIGMNERNAWPDDPLPWRNIIKKLLRRSRFRPQIILLTSYFLKKGFLDGREGFEYAWRKAAYYKLISRLERERHSQ